MYSTVLDLQELILQEKSRTEPHIQCYVIKRFKPRVIKAEEGRQTRFKFVD